MFHTSSSGLKSSEIGSGLAARHRSENSSFRRDVEDKTHLKCSYYGGSRHTKDDCFKLIGFPEWWEEHRQRKAATKASTSKTSGKAHIVTGTVTIEPPLAGHKRQQKKRRKKENRRKREKRGRGSGKTFLTWVFIPKIKSQTLIKPLTFPYSKSLSPRTQN